MSANALGHGAVEWLGVAYRTILTSEETGGKMSITDSLSPPGSGPPRHIHHDADETFVIQTGTCEFWIEGARFGRGAGETAFIPRGRSHTFRVTGDAPCRHLIILSPGGFEAFFDEMAQGKYRIPEDMERINAAAARHNLSFTGPPLDAD